jgi:hypothetical protein
MTMKMRSTFPTLLVLLLAMTIATTQSSLATAPDHGPSAFGQGAFKFFNGFRNEVWSFSFEAMANKNGQARGRAIFDILDNFTETQVVVKIDCLNVQSSSGVSDAVMTGTVLHSDDSDFPKRANVIFAAEDNSGFPTTRADVITPLFVIPFFEGDCRDIGQPLTMFQLSPDAITIEP